MKVIYNDRFCKCWLVLSESKIVTRQYFYGSALEVYKERKWCNKSDALEKAIEYCKLNNYSYNIKYNRISVFKTIKIIFEKFKYKIRLKYARQ